MPQFTTDPCMVYQFTCFTLYLISVNGNCPDCNRFEDESDGYVISSESCGFLSIGSRYVREVLPGEIVELTRAGVRSIAIVERPDNKPPAFCIFEYVYFARSDSIFEGTRKRWMYL